MNWYKVFYWVSVADGMKEFFDIMSSVLLGFSIVSFIIFWIVFFSYRSSSDGSEPTDPVERKEYRYWVTTVRRTFLWCLTLMVITWTLYVAIPSKKDAVMIIAGGAVGNFITSDSSAKQIPAELTLLVREKLKSEVESIRAGDMEDTLMEKTKEELVELLKKKQ